MHEKKSVIFFGTVLAGIISIAAAYALTSRPKISQQSKQEPVEEQKIPIYNPLVTDEVIVKKTTEPIYYYLQGDEKTLKLYEVSGDVRKEIKSVQINLEMFPQEDRKLLQEGIKAFSLEESVKIIENFVS